MGELVEHVDAQDRVVGVMERGTAVRGQHLYRMSMVILRDSEDRYLVHQRPENSPRFPGEYSWMVAGAVGVGESYETAACRELLEEMGVDAPVRSVFKFLCEGQLSPYWFAVHEAVVDPATIAPCQDDAAWHGWLTEAELVNAMAAWTFVSDSRDAFTRYMALRAQERP